MIDKISEILAGWRKGAIKKTGVFLWIFIAGIGLFACSAQEESGDTQVNKQTQSESANETAAEASGGTLPLSAKEKEQESDNPLAAYMQFVPVDKFNPWPEGKTLVPKRGGEITVRIPVDPQSLNPLNYKGQQAAEILESLNDYMMARDSETLELLPLMAWKFENRDLVILKTGDTIEGIIQSRDDEEVEIQPGVGRITIGKQDLQQLDADEGILVTKDGEELTGEITEYKYTVEIETSSTEKLRTIPLEMVSSYSDPLAGNPESQPTIKERVVNIFTLREGLKWSDGEPLTTEDFKLGLQLINNPFVDAARLRSYTQDIQKQEIIDEQTIKYVYSKPYFLAPEVCGSIWPIPAHVIQPEKYLYDEQGLGDFFNSHPSYLPTSERDEATFVGCGPYRLRHWLRGKEVAVERNPNYWAQSFDIPYAPKEEPYLDRITWTVINNKTAALNELQKGTVDVDFDIEPDTWFRDDTNTAEFKKEIVRAKNIVPLYTYIGWNLKRDVFKSARVRRALTMLIPRQKILEDIHYGLGRIVTGPFFIDGPAYDNSIEPLPEDVKQAKRLLRREGWIDRDGDGIIEKDGQPFVFEYMIHSARDYHQKIADIVKENIERAGIRVTIRKLDWTVFGELVNDQEFDAVRLAWSAVVDPDPFQIWHSSQSKNRGSNYVSYDNPEVDRLIEAIRQEFDPIKRWEMDREIHRIIHEDQPYTFLFCFDTLMFYNRKLRNVKLYNVGLGHDLREWCLNYEWQ